MSKNVTQAASPQDDAPRAFKGEEYQFTSTRELVDEIAAYIKDRGFYPEAYTRSPYFKGARSDYYESDYQDAALSFVYKIDKMQVRAQFDAAKELAKTIRGLVDIDSLARYNVERRLKPYFEAENSYRSLPEVDGRKKGKLSVEDLLELVVRCASSDRKMGDRLWRELIDDKEFNENCLPMSCRAVFRTCKKSNSRKNYESLAYSLQLELKQGVYSLATLIERARAKKFESEKSENTTSR